MTDDALTQVAFTTIMEHFVATGSCNVRPLMLLRLRPVGWLMTLITLSRGLLSATFPLTS